MKIKLGIAAIAIFAASTLSAQDKPAQDWFLKSPSEGVNGVSINEAYSTILKNRKSETVVVAVIDSGVDFDHEDLKDVMWVNKGEKAGNGIDDDNNGYVDDIHGWNFIGGKDGQNVNYDNLEVARVYADLRAKYEGKSEADIKGKNAKAEYARYLRSKEEIEENTVDKKANIERFAGILSAIEDVKKALDKDDFTKADLDAFETDDEGLQRGVLVLTNILERNPNGINEVQEELVDYVDYLKSSVDYNYNPDFNPRNIVGDNYADSYEKGYGNNIYDGPDAAHGTHVAGIIAATRGNDIGMDGIADNVEIMTIRAVPNGDERDKDVANAIIYAVDNGASIINMSFGKGWSHDKEVVDKAVKYAMKKDVLLVHAAGNSAQNNDNADNFPNDMFMKRGLFGPKTAKNWMEVGALDWKGDDKAPARFSNYGRANVDVFAPGVDIYSTTPDDNYEYFQGTSMASPVVAGVAAVLRSYYPDLTAVQVKDIIMSSVNPISGKVMIPGGKDEVTMRDLCITAGTINALKAIKLAEKTKGKKKGVTRPRA